VQDERFSFDRPTTGLRPATADGREAVSDSLNESRVVVVGASSGIGRAVALRAVRGGAKVALVARRYDLLAQIAAEAGGGIPISGDVRDSAACSAAISRSGEALQGIDVLCFCAGVAPLALMAETDDDAWRIVIETNVVGANQTIRASLPYLRPSSVVMALSSEVTLQPRTGLGAYGASKAALRASLASWRSECPGPRFCCVTVGATAPTEFGDRFDGPLLGTLLEDWARRGLAQEQMLLTDDVAGVLIATIKTMLDHPEVGIDDLTLRSPSAVVGTAESFASGFAARAADQR
jgi:NADP-dependent 3-hydroxy acid dehydrogenase YdfG